MSNTQSKLTSYYQLKNKKKKKKYKNDNENTINFCKRGISRHSRVQNLLIKHIHNTKDLRTALRASAVKSLLQKVNSIVKKHCRNNTIANYPCHVYKEVSFVYNLNKRCDLVFYIPHMHLLFLIEYKTTSNRKLYEKTPYIESWLKQIKCTFNQAVKSICRSSSSERQTLHMYSLLTTRLYHVDRSKWKYNEDITKVIKRDFIISFTPSTNWLKSKSLKY